MKNIIIAVIVFFSLVGVVAYAAPTAQDIFTSGAKVLSTNSEVSVVSSTKIRVVETKVIDKTSYIQSLQTKMNANTNQINRLQAENIALQAKINEVQ